MSINNDNFYRKDVHSLDQYTQKDTHLRKIKTLDCNFLNGVIQTVSSSAQISETGFEMLQKERDGSKFVFLDLREESHFHVKNFFPICYSNKKHTLNHGKTSKEIIQIESEIIKNLNQDNKINLLDKEDKSKDKDPKKTQAINTIELIKESIISEEDLIKSFQKDDEYFRIPLFSGVSTFSDESIDELVKIVSDLLIHSTKPVKIWAHCSCGRKRSWQAQAIIAMVLFSKTISFEEIFERLGKIGKLSDIVQTTDSQKVRERPSNEHWKKLYTYCKEQDMQKIKWSEWKKISE